MLLKASLIFLNRVNSSSDIYFFVFSIFFYFAFYCIVGLLAIFFHQKLMVYFFNWSKAVILIHHSYGVLFTDVYHINFSSWLIYFQTGLFVESSKNISLKYIYFYQVFTVNYLYYCIMDSCGWSVKMLLCSRACSAVSFRRSILTHDIFGYIFIYMNTYTGSICIHVYIFMYVPHKNVFFLFWYHSVLFVRLWYSPSFDSFAGVYFCYIFIIATHTKFRSR